MSLEKGYSSILILMFSVLVIFIIWAVSQSVARFAEKDELLTQVPQPSAGSTSCRSGDPNDCDDRFNCIRTDASGRCAR